MISNETLLHQPIQIGLGWLDDSMRMNGPTEEDTHFVEDTGNTITTMAEHVAAYTTSMARLRERAVGLGGFYWQLMVADGPEIFNLGPGDADHCAGNLRNWCTPTPSPCGPSTRTGSASGSPSLPHRQRGDVGRPYNIHY